MFLNLSTESTNMDENKKRKMDTEPEDTPDAKRPKAISKIVFPDGSHLKAVLAKLEKFSKEICMVVEPNGVKINAMDSAQSNVIKCWWTDSYFPEYQVERGAVLGLQLEKVNTHVMKSVDGPVHLVFKQVRPDQVLFKCFSKVKQKSESVIDDDVRNANPDSKTLIRLLEFETEGTIDVNFDDLDDQFIINKFRMPSSLASAQLSEIIDKQSKLTNYILFDGTSWYAVLYGQDIEKPVKLPAQLIKKGSMTGAVVSQQTYEKVKSFLSIYDYVDVTLFHLRPEDPTRVTIWWRFGFDHTSSCYMDFASGADATEFINEQDNSFHTKHQLFTLVSGSDEDPL